MIHTTMGVYRNGEKKYNGVPSEYLADHLSYNIFLRPGRALFLDGVCINRGYLSKEEVEKIEAEQLANPIKMTKDTAPYV